LDITGNIFAQFQYCFMQTEFSVNKYFFFNFFHQLLSAFLFNFFHQLLSAFREHYGNIVSGYHLPTPVHVIQ